MTMSGIKILRSPRKLAKGGHTLILGWSHRVYPIIKELAIANENQRKARVALLSPRTLEQVTTDLQSRSVQTKNTKLAVITGDPADTSSLVAASATSARSIIVLGDEGGDDAHQLATVEALLALGVDAATPIVVDVESDTAAAKLRVITEALVISVRLSEVVRRITSQAGRNQGLASVVLDLLDFDGDEIYFESIPALFNKTYADAILAFNTASVIGLVEATGRVLLNPEQSTIIEPGTRIVAIAEDDDKIIYTGVRDEIAAMPVVKSAHGAVRDNLTQAAADAELLVNELDIPSLVMSQLSENPKLITVFEELVGETGASIAVMPIEDYAQIGKPIEFAQLVATARGFGESAVGYRWHSADDATLRDGVQLNPVKTQVITPQAGDALVVITR